jgi:predicted transglutaminase-like protease
LQNCQIGNHLIEKQKKSGKPRISFIKDNLPEDKESEKYKFMIDFLNEFNITPDVYENNLKSISLTSIVSTNDNDINNRNEQ